MTGASVSRGILVWRSVSRLRGRYTILFVLVAVSTAFSIIGISLGSYAGERSSGSAQETARMREITIYPDRAHITESGLSVVRGISAVTEAYPFVRVVGGMTDSAVSVSMVGVDPRSLPPNLVDGSFGPAGDDEWIVLPSRAAGAELSDLLDTVVTITVTTAVDFESGTTRDIPLRVSGIADPSYQVDAVDAAYVSLDRAKTLYFDRLGIAPGELDAVGGYEKATVIVADQRDVGRVVEELQGHGYQAISALQEMQAVPGVIALVRLVSSVVTGGLLVICGITSAMFAVSLVRQRSREFGILRAVGWTARRVQASWIAEMMVVCFGGACVGTSLGLLGGNALAQQVRDAVTNGALSEPYVDVGAALMVVGGLLLATGIAAGVTVAFAARSDVASLLRGLS